MTRYDSETSEQTFEAVSAPQTTQQLAKRNSANFSTAQSNIKAQKKKRTAVDAREFTLRPYDFVDYFWVRRSAHRRKVKESSEKAIKWLTQLAEHGHKETQAELCRTYSI